MDDDFKIIGARIAETRRLRKIKQVDLGAAIGVSDQTVSNWEVGIRTPRADYLRKLCRVLDCSADYLLALSPTLSHNDTLSTAKHKDDEFRFTGMG